MIPNVLAIIPDLFHLMYFTTSSGDRFNHQFKVILNTLANRNTFGGFGGYVSHSFYRIRTSITGSNLLWLVNNRMISLLLQLYKIPTLYELMTLLELD